MTLPGPDVSLTAPAIAQNLVVSGNLVRERRTGEYGRPSQTFLGREGASESREHVYEISGRIAFITWAVTSFTGSPY
ncbi:MAG: hypothetical protein ACR2PT_02805 [Endozoicomonas sp.]